MSGTVAPLQAPPNTDLFGSTLPGHRCRGRSTPAPEWFDDSYSLPRVERIEFAGTEAPSGSAGRGRDLASQDEPQAGDDAEVEASADDASATHDADADESADAAAPVG